MNDVYRLDVNVLVAALVPTHVHHSRVQKWLAQFAGNAWATCPMIQAGVARILFSPSLGSAALTVSDAVSFLEMNLDQPNHQFWPDEIGIAQAVRPFAARLQGHKQLADAYLLGLAIHKDAKFATTDKGVLDLLPEKSAHRNRIAVV